MAQRSHGIFFSIPAGKIYLSPIVDCFDGFIPSWTAGTSPNATLVNEMLLKGVDKLKPDEKPILHMDRGCHYRWQGWIDITKNFGLTRSMSAKGCSTDNSACEGFFGRLKNEFFYVVIGQIIQLKILFWHLMSILSGTMKSE